MRVLFKQVYNFISLLSVSSLPNRATLSAIILLSSGRARAQSNWRYSRSPIELAHRSNLLIARTCPSCDRTDSSGIRTERSAALFC